MQAGSLISPHGGALVDRVLRGSMREAVRERAKRLKRVVLSPLELSDLELLAVGAYSPLTGFMIQEDYRNVLESTRLASGVVWSVPITLAVADEQARDLNDGDEVALLDPQTSEPVGVLLLTQKFPNTSVDEARLVYRTTDPGHPGVARVLSRGDVLLGGDVWLIDRPADRPFAGFRHDPAESRRLFAARGWRTVVGFQTRNPIHRSHEYIQKTALEIVDGLFLHPIVGETKEGDIPADVRIASYQALLRDYYPPDRVILGVFPAAMRYAGPREAIFHALCRKNYGCTHFIVGRDHAGVGKFYGPYDAQKIFGEFRPEEIGITPLFFENTFYCRKCGGIVSAKTCPHDESHHIVLSGTEVRRRLERGEALPPEFTRPEVARVLASGLRTDAEVRPRMAAVKASSSRRRVLLVGLDSAEPSLVFGPWRDTLPNLKRLMEGGTYGTLESVIPCITVPAWACMMASKDPGQLGLYGFHNRADYSYEQMTIANATAVREPLLWDILGGEGKQVVVIGVPPSYPPRPVNGVSVGCFLTPSIDREYTYPAGVADEIRKIAGEYLVDVPNFRTNDKDHLLQQIYDMTEKRFAVVRRFMTNKPWDLFMFVEIGVDRVHHGLWKHHDSTHRSHEPGNRHQNAIFEYYRFLDKQVGELLGLLDDDTVVWVLSDHGAKRMDGGVCLNEWLIGQGYLVLKDKPTGVVPLQKCEIDWARTRAWGGGGYYGRVFLNVAGREPHGIVAPVAYEALRDELTDKLAAIRDPAGRPMDTRVYKPETIYRRREGIPPDLMIYFGDLFWRAVGAVGLDRIHTFDNDTGPDDANHAQFGMFICHDPRRQGAGEWNGAHLLDVAPTVLRQAGMKPTGDMVGRVLEFAG